MKWLRERFGGGGQREPGAPQEQRQPKPSIFARFAKWAGIGGGQDVQQPGAQPQQQQPPPQPQQPRGGLMSKFKRGGKTDPKVKQMQELLLKQGVGNFNKEQAEKIYHAYQTLKLKAPYGVKGDHMTDSNKKAMRSEIMSKDNVEAFAMLGGLEKFNTNVVGWMSQQEAAANLDQELGDKSGVRSMGALSAQRKWQDNSTSLVTDLYKNVLEKGDYNTVNKEVAIQEFLNFPRLPSDKECLQLIAKHSEAISECGGINKFFDENVAPYDANKAEMLKTQTKLAIVAQEFASLPIIPGKSPSEAAVESITKKYSDILGDEDYTKFIKEHVAPMNEAVAKELLHPDLVDAADRSMLYEPPKDQEEVFDQPEGGIQQQEFDAKIEGSVTIGGGDPHKDKVVETIGGEEGERDVVEQEQGLGGESGHEVFDIEAAKKEFLEYNKADGKIPNPEQLMKLLDDHQEAIEAEGGYEQFIDKNIGDQQTKEMYLNEHMVGIAKGFASMNKEGSGGIPQPPPLPETPGQDTKGKGSGDVPPPPPPPKQDDQQETKGKDDEDAPPPPPPLPPKM